MPSVLDTRESTFSKEFNRFLDRSRETDDAVAESVASIIGAVRKEGDGALLDLTARFDNLELTSETLAFRQDEIESATARVPNEEKNALRLAFERIMAFHQREVPQNTRWTDETGAEVGWKWTAVESAGVYVPGGTASYPSSVLMNAVPALVAGVDDIVMATPVPGGDVNPLVLYAAGLCGITSIFKVGGAQAIAALAFGTETIRPVDTIVGPGNAYVANAKRQIFGTTGIDLVAGPTEILVIADPHNEPDWVAIDLLSQAEHDQHARAILVTPDRAFGDAVVKSVETQLETLARRRIASESWQRNGAVIIVRDLAEAAEISNRIAPEHVSVMTSDPELVAEDIRNAGALFLGRWTPEAIGDYVAGPNHVLPTSGNARFSSGLSVLEFMKRTTIMHMTPRALEGIGPAAMTLANSESLFAHEHSVRMRLARIQSERDG